MSQALHKCLHQ